MQAAPTPTPELPEQIAQLTPRLKTHLRVHVQRFRGEPWYVVEDPVSNRFHRFGVRAYQVMRLLDGSRSVGEVCRVLQERVAPHPPPAAEVAAFVGDLHTQELLDTGFAPRAQSLFERYGKRKRALRAKRLMSPISVRVALLDPDAFLERTAWVARGLFSPLVLLAWVAGLTLAALQAGEHWPDLVAHFETRALEPQNLALLWLLYPPMKILHEFAHAYAVKRWGGRVHEMGLMLLVFTPVPYVDASSSIAFASRHRRMLVAASGIMAELALAALGLAAWIALEPGLARDVAFNVVLVGAGSTVLFNANPLLRFDGYYVLADLLEIPNLATRSSRYLGYLAERYLYGIGDARSPVTAPRERAWFVAYGLASLFYRTVVMFTIALYLAGQLFVLGMLLAAWVLVAQVGMPVWRQLAFVLTSPRLGPQRPRAVALVLCLLAVGVTGLTTVPIGATTFAQGVVRLPEGTQLRAGASGLVRAQLARDGLPVAAGQAVFRLEDPFLDSELKRAGAAVRELKRLQARTPMSKRVEAQVLEARRHSAEAELREIRARAGRLRVHSPADGLLELPSANDLLGRYVEQGHVLGRVVAPGRATARVVLDQRQAARVSEGTRGIQVRLASRAYETLDAAIGTRVPAAVQVLPSPALGQPGGGLIATLPGEEAGTQAMEKVFQLELELPGDGRWYLPGERVHVRFRHAAEPLAVRCYEYVQRLLMERLKLWV